MEMLDLGLIEEVATLKSNSENHKGLQLFGLWVIGKFGLIWMGS